MSAITPEVSESSDRAPTFNRPNPPAPNADRDSEMLNYYFDATWTTKDIAEHFKLSVAVVAAWFQRPDIAAMIEFITAANERRARDIARENLPGTIDILLRISRLRNNDNLSRAASSALITFARGRANSKSAAKHASTASARSRSADASPPRGQHTSDVPNPQHVPTTEVRDPSCNDDTCAALGIALTPGRSPDVPRGIPSPLPHTASDALQPGEPGPEPIALHPSHPHGVAC